MNESLEQLYREAQAAIKARQYDRAADLLKQILVLDEDYKDASRLLAQTVKWRRRRWHSHPVLWGILALALLVGLGVWLIPRIRFSALAAPPPSATVKVSPPTRTPVPTATSAPTATAVPLAWKRISIGQEFLRDTVTAIAFDPKDADVIYVGMEHAGIYKTIDGGQSWKPSLKGLQATQITSLVVDKINPNILFAGVSRVGLYQSHDGGETWAKVNVNAQVNALVVVRQVEEESNLFYYQQGSLIFSSTDGETWNRVSTPGCYVEGKSAFAVHPQNGQKIYVTCPDGLYKSLNGGKTWEVSVRWNDRNGSTNEAGATSIFATGLWVEAMPDGSDAFYVASNYRDRDLSAGRIDDPYWWSLANFCSESFGAHPNGGGFVFCNNGLFLLEDGGASKKRLTNPGIGMIETLAVSPYDANTLFAGGQGLAKSTDGGLTWTILNNGLGAESARLIKPDMDPMVFYLVSPSSTCTEAATDFKVVFRSLDQGQTWVQLKRSGCYFSSDPDGKTLYITGDFNPNAEGYFVPGTRVWVGVEKFILRIFRSTDQGQSWVALPQTGIVFTNPVNSGYVYAWDPRGQKAYISLDYGNTWNNMIRPPVHTQSGLGLAFDTSGSIIFAHSVDDESIYRSKDTGNRWNLFVENMAGNILIADPGNPNRLWLVNEDGTVSTLEDGSIKFTSAVDISKPFINTLVIDPASPSTIYAGTDSGAYVSYDHGQTWGQINDGLLGATVVYSIVVDKDGNVYAATPYGIFKLEAQ